MNLNSYKEAKPNFIRRIFWFIVNRSVFRILCTRIFSQFRILLLKIFGADIEWGIEIYSSVDIFAPWNLSIGKYSCIGPNTTIYNKAPIVIGENCVISQGAYLCTASHDISKKSHDLITKPIIIKNRAWVAAEAFVGMGVTIGEGAVVGARAAVFKDVEPWTVVGGNPAKVIKKRVIN